MTRDDTIRRPGPTAPPDPASTVERRLRVVTLVDSLGLAGGGERFARLVALGLDRRRFESTLCVSRWSPAHAEEPFNRRALDALGRAGVGFLGLERRSTLSLAAWRPLMDLLRGGTDILHAHKFGSNVWAAVLGPRAGVSVVVAHEQTWSFRGQPLRRLLDRELIARRADAFIAVSSADRRRMIDVEGISPDRLVLIPNAIPDPPQPGGRDIRSELRIGPGDPVVGTVCSLRAQKALEVLVQASAILRKEFPHLRVLIVGEGEERFRLEALIGALDLEGTVRLLGYRPDVSDLVHAFDVATSCSDYEGTPLAVMEYMAAARPVVATRVGGVPDLIEPGVEGMLVEPRQPAAFAAALAELLRDRDAAGAMGMRAQERQRREFSIGVAVRRIERLYEELHGAAAAGGLGGSGGDVRH